MISVARCVLECLAEVATIVLGQEKCRLLDVAYRMTMHAEGEQPVKMGLKPEGTENRLLRQKLYALQQSIRRFGRIIAVPNHQTTDF